MLNKDCKVRNTKAKNQNKKNFNKSKRPKSKTVSSTPKHTNSFFYIMVVLWIIPVFISAYILYKQYNIYVDKNKEKKRVVRLRNRKPPISREQLKKLRRQMKKKVFTSENTKNDSVKINKNNRIYLVKVNRVLGRVYLKPVDSETQSINNVDTAIKTLISYKLSAGLKKRAFYTCIPGRTKLLGYKLKKGTLSLNFNKDFMDYSKGPQQIRLKAAQIVYTATQFPGIKRVKFLIDNKVLKDWGGEGVFFSPVLSRSDVPRVMRIN